MTEIHINVCMWIGECGCCRPALLEKSYCEEHYSRMYDVFYPEMADYLIEQELNSEQK